MNFAAGMGAGISIGIAIGLTTGRRKAVEQLREHCLARSLTIHERSGQEIPIDTWLSEAIVQEECTHGSRKAIALIAAVLAGIAIFAGVVYFALA